MNLKPSTRHFLSAAAGVAVLAIAYIGGGIFRFLRFTSVGDRNADLQFVLIEGGFFGAILALGLGLAWLRLVRDRKERARRRPPADFG